MLIGEFVKNVSENLQTVAVGGQEELLLRRYHRPWVALVNPDVWAEAKAALEEKRAREAGVAA